MKMKAYASFDEYQRDQTPKNQAVIRALRKFVKGVAPQLVRHIKLFKRSEIDESAFGALLRQAAK